MTNTTRPDDHDLDWVIREPCGCPVGLSERRPGCDTESDVWREHFFASEPVDDYSIELMTHAEWAATVANVMKARVRHGCPHAKTTGAGR